MEKKELMKKVESQMDSILRNEGFLKHKEIYYRPLHNSFFLCHQRHHRAEGRGYTARQAGGDCYSNTDKHPAKVEFLDEEKALNAYNISLMLLLLSYIIPALILSL